MADNNGDLGSFLAGFVIGGLIGAGVALLMAPQSGEETRGLIKDKSIELRDRAVETADDARAKADQFAQQARERAAEIQVGGKPVFGKKESVPTVDEAVATVKKAVE
jgi:gas vesicle protein